MLHAKFQDHRTSGYGEEDFLRFLPYTLIECSNRSPKRSDIYQSLAVAEQYVLYHDIHFHQIILKTE